MANLKNGQHPSRTRTLHGWDHGALTLAAKHQSTVEAHRRRATIGCEMHVGLGDDDILHKGCEEQQLKHVEERWLYVRRIGDPRL